MDELLQIIKEDSLSNVTFTGGDPFYQVDAFTELARRIKQETGKTIWCWTGFTYEEILADEHLAQMLPRRVRRHRRPVEIAVVSAVLYEHGPVAFTILQ